MKKRGCIHPEHINKPPPRASFNFPDEKKPLYCKAHSQDGMINFNNRNNMCQKCKQKQPSYGILGGKSTHCSKCADKNIMIDLVSNLCDKEGCRKNATYGLPENKATRCKPHADENMIDVKNAKCKLCNKQATYGITKKATHCIKHKTEDMIDVKHNTEKCQNCSKRATYSLGKRPTHCTEHKTNDMKDVVSKMCKKCGETQSVFGLTKEELFCKNCSTVEMKNLKHIMCEKCQNHQPSFNYKNTKVPRFCKGCALDGMIDIINPMCKSCGLFMVCKKPHLCSYCKPGSTLREKTKEMMVVNHLQEQGYEFIHNKSVGYVCGNFRPDIKIDVGTHFIIVEIDEDQHKQYDVSCETARMFNICQAEGLPCIFIRYNPDVYRVNGKAKKVQASRRLATLIKCIEKYKSMIPTELLTVYRLFYDSNTEDYVCKYDIDAKYEKMIELCQDIQ